MILYSLFNMLFKAAATKFLALTAGSCAAVLAVEQPNAALHIREARPSQTINIPTMVGGTAAWCSASSNAIREVQKAAHIIKQAEINPYDRHPLEWTGTGIDCDGSMLCPDSDDSGVLDKFRAIVSVINMDYKYGEHELIGCVEGAGYFDKDVCMFLEGTKRNLTGMCYQYLREDDHCLSNQYLLTNFGCCRVRGLGTIRIPAEPAMPRLRQSASPNHRGWCQRLERWSAKN